MGAGVSFRFWSQRFLMTLVILASFSGSCAYTAASLPEVKPVVHVIQKVQEPALSETITDNRPLEEVYQHQESLIDWGDLVKMYTVFGVLLLILVGVLIWLKKSGLADQFKQQQSFIKTPMGQTSFNPVSFTLPKVQTERQKMSSSDEAPCSQFEQEKALYKPMIAHREALGSGKELVTVFLAGKWYLVGVTGAQIQLIATVSSESESNQMLASGLKATVADDASFGEVYEKYVNPERDKQNPVATGPNQQPVNLKDYQVDDLEEFEIPDFEDVFEQV